MRSKNELTRRKRKIFTQEQKIYAITLLRENNFDYKKTALETGASIICLRQWKHKLSDMMTNEGRIAVYQERAEEKMISKKIDFIENHFGALDEVTKLTLDRIKKLLPDSTITEATGVLKAISDIYKIIGQSKDDKEKGESIDVIAQVINQQVNINS